MLEISIYLNHMHGENTCFVWKIDLRMFMIKIESYGDIIFYFCKIGNMKEIFDFVLYDPVNEL